jgi:MoaA/NifB/PqqE/SkfB family radical SAM enzyme
MRNWNFRDAIIWNIFRLLGNRSEENIRRVYKLLGKIYPSVPDDPIVARAFRSAFGAESTLPAVFKRIVQECNPTVVRKVVETLIIRWNVTDGRRIRQEYKEQHGHPPPTFFVISPTMACNLRCTGCYAAGYTKEDDLPVEYVDKAISEGKELGVFFITISGGEPFIREDLLDIYAKHSDVFFLVYTNGCVLKPALAEKLGKLGNVAPGISVEGFERETDERRGRGMHRRILEAMENLRRAGVLFGMSITPTRFNSDVISSEEFLDYYIERGVKFAWFFQYIPIGRDPDPDLMSTPEQRNRLREAVWEARKTKPVFIGDFWNDGPLARGCMAGGRAYFHINVHGDYEPCVFQQFAVDNVREKSIRELIESEYFQAIREAMKDFRHNWFMPCMIIDHPCVLRELVKTYGAYPTYPDSKSLVDDPAITQFLDQYSERMEEVTEPKWQECFGDLSPVAEKVHG